MRSTLGILALLFLPIGAEAAVIEACVNTGNGGLRLVASTTVCHANETRVTWNTEGPAGPAGPAGPQGPAGDSAGGPPYVYVCTPANYHNAGTSTESLYVFNGGAATANVAVNFLNKNGINLTGQPIPVSPGSIPPGDPAPLYPGQTGATTAPLGAANTLYLAWLTAQANLETDTNVAITIRITSDQPIVAATNTQFGEFNVVPCMALPR